jgi:putative ABC transport system substrate-binding protein
MAGKARGAGNGWLFSLLAILLASAAVVALDAFSNLGTRQPARPVKIGVLSPTWADNRGSVYAEFVRGLAALGYVEGSNVTMVTRFADGREERLPVFAAELVSENVDVIVALQPSGALAAMRATTTIPIVFISISDPVRIGLVESLRRPAGNVTGVANAPADLNPKRLEILKDALPSLRRIAVLARSGNANSQAHLDETLKAAAALGLQARVYNVVGPADIAGAFEAMVRDASEAVLVVQDGVLFFERKRIAGFAVQHRLATIADGHAYAHDGMFMSYGIGSYGSLSAAAAEQVDMILNGVPVGDIPVDQPGDLGLAVNLNVARALGIAVDRSLLLRANEVIDR